MIERAEKLRQKREEKKKLGVSKQTNIPRGVLPLFEYLRLNFINLAFFLLYRFQIKLQESRLEERVTPRKKIKRCKVRRASSPNKTKSVPPKFKSISHFQKRLQNSHKTTYSTSSKFLFQPQNFSPFLALIIKETPNQIFVCHECL